MSRLEMNTPWPIEKKGHPKFGEETPEKMESNSAETAEGKELAELAFNNPESFRAEFLDHVKVENKESFHGKSFLCVWPTKFCPVGCEVCFFKSPKCAGGKHETDTAIKTEEGKRKVIQFINDANATELVIAGGGEPFMEKVFMQQIAESASADKMFFSSSGIWAKNIGSAEVILANLHDAHVKNPNRKKLELRLSFDKYHAEKIDKDGNFEYAINLMSIFRTRYKDDANFRIGLHAMWEDKDTVEKFLDKLPVQKRERKNTKTEIITLEDGYVFEIRWKRLFYSDTHVDMNRSPIVERNISVFDEDISSEHSDNMSVVFHDEGEERGADFLIHYDGTILNWGASSPDNEASIYTHTYKEAMRQAFDDVVSLSFLEKGNRYRDRVISEVNPKAVRRAKAMNLRDFYSRVVLEEARTRLYLSIRATQDYIKEGRITGEEVEKWSENIKRLVAMSQGELADAYAKSQYSIVKEYLESKNVNAQKLFELYKLVRLGHYDVTPQQMLEEVEKIKFEQREQFEKLIAQEFAGQISNSYSESQNEVRKERNGVELLDASKAIFLCQKELAIAKEMILAALPEKVRARYGQAFDFLLSENLANMTKGIHEIQGKDVYVEVLQKPGKGKDGAVSEVHFEHTDLQIVVSKGGDIIGLNSKESAGLQGATPDPKREGFHLTSKPDQWREIEQNEIIIIFPLTPHAPGGGDKNRDIKRLVVKVKN